MLFDGADVDDNAPAKSSARESSGQLFPGYYTQNHAFSRTLA
jgi:hypothetical protein